jgi:hypothetical protein
MRQVHGRTLDLVMTGIRNESQRSEMFRAFQRGSPQNADDDVTMSGGDAMTRVAFTFKFKTFQL